MVGLTSEKNNLVWVFFFFFPPFPCGVCSCPYVEQGCVGSLGQSLAALQAGLGELHFPCRMQNALPVHTHAVHSHMCILGDKRDKFASVFCGFSAWLERQLKIHMPADCKGVF